MVVGETQLTLKCCVNIDTKDKIDNFILEIGDKSGTADNKYKGDNQGKGKKK